MVRLKVHFVRRCSWSFDQPFYFYLPWSNQYYHLCKVWKQVCDWYGRRTKHKQTTHSLALPFFDRASFFIYFGQNQEIVA